MSDEFFPNPQNGGFSDKENVLKLYREHPEEDTEGNFYEITPDAKKLLDALMYWISEKKLALQKNDAEILNVADEILDDLMQGAGKLGIPDWVCQKAIAFAEENNLRERYSLEFYQGV